MIFLFDHWRAEADLTPGRSFLKGRGEVGLSVCLDETIIRQRSG
jgi:hypothetical protein